MSNQVGEADYQLDPRESAAVDDPTITIEYLRARLHAERSVSKASRERVQQLAQRVSELEEQLNIVVYERKKAEKATLDVLAVLERHGIGEISEGSDSDSGLDESYCQPKLDKSNLVQEDRSSVNSKLKEVSSGSEQETTLSTGRSLSWNSRRDCPQSHERRYPGLSHRRRTNYAHSGTLLKHLHGKSCRRVKRREIKSVVEQSRLESTSLEAEGADAGGCLAHIMNSLDSRMEDSRRFSETQDKNASFQEKISGSLETENHVPNAAISIWKCGYDGKMERALQHQAQLIGCYEAEEKAQREWEEKYRKNGNGTLDACEPGSHSDVTDDRDEMKDVVPQSAAAIITENSHGHKSIEASPSLPKQTSMAHFDSFKFDPRGAAEHHDDGKSGDMHFRASAPEFAFPVIKNTQAQSSGEKHSSHSDSRGSQYHHPSNDLASNRVISSLHDGNYSNEGKTSKSRKEQHEVVSYEGDDQIGGILGALQRAKLFIGQHIKSLPSLEAGSVGRTVERTGSITRDLKFSVGSAGLFRVPTDFQLEAGHRSSLGSKNSSRYYHSHVDPSLPPASSNRYLVEPMEGTIGSSSPFSDSPSTGTESKYSSIRQSYGASLRTPGKEAYFLQSTYSGKVPGGSSREEMVHVPSPSRAFAVPPTRTSRSVLFDDHHVGRSTYR